jgi:uncharacterized phage protein (TIGR02216 family)
VTFAGAVPRLFAIAAQRLGWTPDCFWRATPADLLLALGPTDPANAPLTRTDLARMMELDAHG